jgi:serine/threonine-protein kinase
VPDYVASGLTKANFAARYSILKLLGSGAYGKVFLARQNALSRLVAVKFFSPRRIDCLQEDAARFLRETQLLGRLSHPRIVPVFDANLLGRSRFLVTEYLDGGDLSRHLTPGRPLAPPEAVRLGLAVAEGLEYLHSEAVVHRDLKPENILLGLDGAVKLTDFGLARSLESGQAVTTQGAMLGTPAYLAPETIRTGTATAASDVYAFGILLFEAFDGRYPYDAGESVPELLTRKVELDAFLPGPQVPPALAPLVSACLAREPSRRPSARRLKAVLAAMSRESGYSSGVQLPASPQRPRAATERLGDPTVLARCDLPTGASENQAGVPGFTERGPARHAGTTRLEPMPRSWPSRGVLAAVGGCLLLLASLTAVVASGVFSRLTLAPVPVQTPAPAPQPSPAPVVQPPPPRLDEALLQRLCDSVHPAQFQWQIRAAMEPGAMLARLDKRGVGPVVRRMLATGEELPAEGMNESVLVKAVESLQTLRVAVGRFWALGRELPAEYARVVERSFPLRRGVPPGASRVLEIGSGFPVEIPLELDVILGGPGWQWPVQVPPAVTAEWARRSPRRLWWVMQVRELNLRCVVDVRVETIHGTERLPLLPATGPVRDREARYSGPLALGFDYRWFRRVKGPVQITYCILAGALCPVPPSLEKLELWEEPAR